MEASKNSILDILRRKHKTSYNMSYKTKQIKTSLCIEQEIWKLDILSTKQDKTSKSAKADLFGK